MFRWEANNMRRIALSFCVLFGVVTLACAWGPSGQRLFGEHCRTALPAAAASQYQTDPQAAVLIARWDNEAGATTNDIVGVAHLTRQGFSSAFPTNIIVGTNFKIF